MLLFNVSFLLFPPAPPPPPGFPSPLPLPPVHHASGSSLHSVAPIRAMISCLFPPTPGGIWPGCPVPVFAPFSAGLASFQLVASPAISRPIFPPSFRHLPRRVFLWVFFRRKPLQDLTIVCFFYLIFHINFIWFFFLFFEMEFSTVFFVVSLLFLCCFFVVSLLFLLPPRD